jgi:putative cell wall-binding protein
MSDQVIQKLLGENLVFVIGGGVAIVAIVASSIKSIVASVTRERSRREIAAYIAEKSMTPEEGERLMAAGGRRNT